MSPAHHELEAQAVEIFLLARKFEGERRQQYLDETCGNQSTLRELVQDYLLHDDLDRPLRELRDEIADVDREIGRGGMGAVYLAQQKSLGRTVAVKKLLVTRSLADENQRQLVREARLAARLTHPGIVPIYEVGKLNGEPCMLMEYVAHSVDSLLKSKGSLDPIKAAEITMRAAEAVNFGHQRGVVHRDIKPSNILLDEHGHPKLTDFGIAADARDFRSSSQPIGLAGTPAYMSPEQSTGQRDRHGPATDIYSLGAVLYALLTGTPPFTAPSVEQILQKVVSDRPEPPQLRNPRVPTGLAAISLKCLEKEPNRRYQSAEELAVALAKWIARRKARRLTLTLISVLAVAVLATASSVFLWRHSQQAGEEARESAVKRVGESVRAVLIASPGELPAAIDQLTTDRAAALPILRAAFETTDNDETERLHAACALAAFGIVEEDFLVESVSAAPAAECRNVIGAIDAAGERVKRKLLVRAKSESDAQAKARYCATLLQLRQSDATQEMLRVTSDPTQRTAFIDTFKTWHGGLRELPSLLLERDDESLRSGICASIGKIPGDSMDGDTRGALQAMLAELYRLAPDGGTHSAAGWALNQWNEPLPPFPKAEAPRGNQGWFTNGQDMTMLAIPAGTFEMGDDQQSGISALPTTRHQVTITTPFFMCDREIWVELFQRFMDDPAYPAEEKPRDWSGPDAMRSPTPDCPVQQVSWLDAVLFCNWLSHVTGREPCYTRTGRKISVADRRHGEDAQIEADEWECKFSLSGYRLPTEAEWEFACRAQTRTAWCFGDDPTLFAEYAVFIGNSQQRSWPAGSRLPNAWGLFDMHGNVSEWCWDWAGFYSPEPAIDPRGPMEPGQVRILRGGWLIGPPELSRSAHRYFEGPLERNPFHGFRVVCSGN